MKRLYVLMLCASLVAAASCGCQKKESLDATGSQRAAMPRSEQAPLHTGQAEFKQSVQGGLAAVDAQKQADGKKEPLERKVIFNADFQLTVADFAKAEQALLRLIQDVKGFAAKADVAGAAGGSQGGTWKVRVPADRFDAFKAAVKQLGDLIRYTSDAQDVSEEYYDLVSRIKSKEDELVALRKLFDKGSGKIEDVLAVQREVSRAQLELEQLKGRQRVLENLTELTTITIHLQQRGTYQPTEPPTFGTTVEGTFSSSCNALLGFGKVLVIVAAAVAPWLPLLAVAGLTIWLIVRRVGRSNPVTPIATEVPKTS
jgi:hypothetical protein